MDKYYLTKERLEELRQELQKLKTVRRLEVADHLRRAKEYGDLSENAEYVEAKEEQRQVESRIYELEDLLKRAVIIKKKKGSETVQIGSRVTAEKDGKSVEYTIVGVSEADPAKGKISNESPLGRTLLGRKVGDSVEIMTPVGKVIYHITKIE